MEHHPTALVTADPTQVGALYTTAEVATLVRVHQRTVQEWIRAGMLPAVRYGRLLRIRQAELARFGEVLTRPAPAGAAQEEAPPSPPVPAPRGAAARASACRHGAQKDARSQYRTLRDAREGEEPREGCLGRGPLRHSPPWSASGIRFPPRGAWQSTRS